MKPAVACLSIALALVLTTIPTQAGPDETTICHGNAGPPQGEGNVIDQHFRVVPGTDGDYVVMEWYYAPPMSLPAPLDGSGWLFQGACELIAQILKCLRDAGNAPAECILLLVQLPAISYNPSGFVYLQSGAASSAMTQEALVAFYFPT